jgi:hypothetical protein
LHNFCSCIVLIMAHPIPFLLGLFGTVEETNGIYNVKVVAPPHIFLHANGNIIFDFLYGTLGNLVRLGLFALVVYFK